MDEATRSATAMQDGAVDPDGRAADRVARQLADQIERGALSAGQRLPTERALTERFGVSRTVVREAIAGLANRGLVEVRRGFRPIVRRPHLGNALEQVGNVVAHLVRDEAGARTLFESRALIEGALARHAALHATGNDLAELRTALDLNRRAIGDADAFYASDVAFHALLYRLPRNPVYPVLHEAYVAWLQVHWRRMHHAPDIDRLNFAGHLAMVDAIAGRDADAAEAALRRHLDVAWEYVRSTFFSGEGS